MGFLQKADMSQYLHGDAFFREVLSFMDGFPIPFIRESINVYSNGRDKGGLDEAYAALRLGGEGWAFEVEISFCEINQTRRRFSLQAAPEMGDESTKTLISGFSKSLRPKLRWNNSPWTSSKSSLSSHPAFTACVAARINGRMINFAQLLRQLLETPEYALPFSEAWDEIEKASKNKCSSRGPAMVEMLSANHRLYALLTDGIGTKSVI